MAKFLDKVLGAVGFDIVDEAEESTVDSTRQITGSTDEIQPAAEISKEKPVKRVTADSDPSKQVKVVINKPGTFFEAQSIADHLKQNRQVILNLEETDKEVAQKLVDFVSGAIYALNGTIKKIGDNIFLCVPVSVDVYESANQENYSTGHYSWMSEQ